MNLFLKLIPFLFVSVLFSQKGTTIKGDWSIVYEEEGIVVISKRTVEINDVKNDVYKMYFQYKFENITEEQLHLDWNFITKYNMYSSSELPTNENYRSLTLEPNESFIPEFSNKTEKQFFVFKKFLKKSTNVVLDTVELFNLKVKAL